MQRSERVVVAYEVEWIEEHLVERVPETEPGKDPTDDVHHIMERVVGPDRRRDADDGKPEQRNRRADAKGANTTPLNCAPSEVVAAAMSVAIVLQRAHQSSLDAGDDLGRRQDDLEMHGRSYRATCQLGDASLHAWVGATEAAVEIGPRGFEHVDRAGEVQPNDTPRLGHGATLRDLPARALRRGRGGGYGFTVAPAEHVDVELAGRAVSVTSPDKVMFPEHGTTKLDVVRYYAAVEDPLMRAMGRRPVLMQRFPGGVGKSSFFQKRVPDNAPDWLETTIVSTPNGTTSRALVAADIAHVAWAVNLGCLGFHVWPNTADDPEHADELRIDLDPQPGVTFDDARVAAHEVRRLFDELGIESWPKTTGNRGIHVYVRLERRWSPIEVRAAAVAVARELARRRPDAITDAWWKEERGERVFIDFNQNAPHKTVFGAWSVRARPDGQVSTPFSWDQLDDIDPEALTIRTVPDHVARHGDPWEQIDSRRQSLDPLLEMSERDLASGLQDAPWPPVYPKMPGEPPRVAPSRAKKAPGPG